MGCVQLTETFLVTCKTIANFLFSCRDFQTSPNCSFSTTKMAAQVNKVYVCLFVTESMQILIALLLFICFYINSYNIYIHNY